MKYICFAISDSSLDCLSEYLKENSFSNTLLGFTLSFGKFHCEVRAKSEYIYNLAEFKYPKPRSVFNLIRYIGNGLKNEKD